VYLSVTATHRWLLDRWRIRLDAALSQPPARDRVRAWMRCAIAEGWREGVTLADVYRIELLPLRTEPVAASAWKSERYCRVSSGVMPALANALDRAAEAGIETDLLRRFTSDLRAARQRAAEVIDA
jgi:hypothetical protein